MKKRVLFICLISLFSSLTSFAQEFEVATPSGHSAMVIFATFNKDGSLVATSSSDKSARIWEVATGRLLHTFKHNYWVDAVIFNPDGRSVLTLSRDWTTKLWSLKTGKLIKSFRNGTFPTNYAVFNSIGSKVAIAYGNVIVLWSGYSGEFLNTLKMPDSDKFDDIKSMDFADWETNQLVATIKNSVYVWNLKESRLVTQYTVANEEKETLVKAEFSPDATILVTTSREVLKWDHQKGTTQSLFKIAANSPAIGWVLYSPDREKLAIVRASQRVEIRNTGTGELINSMIELNARYPGTRFSRDSKRLLTYRKNLSVWDIASGKRMFKVNSSKELKHVTFDPSGKKILLVPSFGESAKLINIESKKEERAFQNKMDEISRLSLSADGQKIAMAFEGQNHFIIRDLNNLQLIHKFELHQTPVISLQFLPGKNELMSVEQNGTVILWDLNQGIPKAVLQHTPSETYNTPVTIFSPDGEMIVQIINQEELAAWDVKSQKLLYSIDIGRKSYPGISIDESTNSLIVSTKSGGFNVYDLATGRFRFAQDGKRATKDPTGRYMAEYEENVVRLWDIRTGKLHQTLKKGKEDIVTISFSPNGENILTASQNKLYVWSVAKGKVLNTMKSSERIWKAFFYDGGDKIWMKLWGLAELRDAKSGEVIKQLNLSGNQFVPGTFGTYSSMNSDYRAISLEGTAWKLWDMKNATLLANFEGYYVTSSQSDDKYHILTNDNGVIKFWDGNTGKKLVEYLQFSDSDENAAWVLPEGYYTANKEAVKSLYFRNQVQTLSFEQLDVRYNRPDKVLEAMQSRDTALIRKYKLAYQARLSKLNFDTTTFKGGINIPEAQIVNATDIGLANSTGKLTLKLNFKDSVTMLDRIQVLVNKVPLFGSQGLSIRERKKYAFDTTLNVSLSKGNNEISARTTNYTGIKSLDYPIVVNYQPATTTSEKVYFIGMAVDRFKDQSRNLKYSVKDIRDLAAEFKKKYGPNLVIDTLFNEQFSPANIDRIKQKLQNTTVDDKVIVAYSGHGLLDFEIQYFFPQPQTKFTAPETGVAFKKVESLLDNIPSRKKLLLIDACYSGDAMFPDSPNITTSDIAFMQQVFVNIDNDIGAAIIGATAGNAKAVERQDLSNGVFTYAILQFMREKDDFTLGELKAFVDQQVLKLTNGNQRPVSRSEYLFSDWRL